MDDVDLSKIREELDRQGFASAEGPTRTLRRVAKELASVPGVDAKLFDIVTGRPSYTAAASDVVYGTAVVAVVADRYSFADAIGALQAHPERRERLQRFQVQALSVEV